MINLQVTIDRTAIEHVRKLYIDPTHAVFNLVPPAFNAFLEECYTSLQRPPVGRATAWTVYLDMLDLIRHREEAQALLQVVSEIGISVHEDEALPLLDGLQDLPFDATDGNYYMGGVGGGLGLRKLHIQVLDASTNLSVYYVEQEHIDALNILEEDEPGIDNDDEHEAGPMAIVTAFSDDDDDDGGDDLFLDEW